LSQSREEQLFLACFRGDLSLVDSLCSDQSAIKVNWRHPRGQFTSLFAACQNGHAEVVRRLLAVPKIDPNLMASQDVTPFFIACQENKVEAVRAMLESSRVDVNSSQRDNVSPFFAACRRGNVAVIEALLREPRVRVNQARGDGATPLLMACSKERLEPRDVQVIRMLLDDTRIDVTLADNRGCTPFFFACQNGSVEVVELLLAHEKMRVMVETRFARELGLPAQDYPLNAVTATRTSPFLVACERGRAKVVELLLREPKIDFELEGEGEITPLWMTAQHGHLLVAQLILAETIISDPTKKSNVGKEKWRDKSPVEQGRRQPEIPRGTNEAEEEFDLRTENGPKIATLLEDYEKNRGETRAYLRRTLQLTGSLRFKALLSFAGAFSPSPLSFLAGRFLAAGIL